MDKNLLFYYLKSNGDTVDDLANGIGIHPQTLRKKMNGHSEFSASEIKAIADRYKLTADEVVRVFLSDKGRAAKPGE